MDRLIRPGHNGGPALDDRWYQTEATASLFDFYDKPRLLDAKGVPIRKNALICLPGGTGKSVVIANFLRQAFALHPSTRAIMSTHVKTLITQNAKQLLKAWPLAPLGIYSAGLKSADFVQPIIFGGIQSLVGKYPKFGYRDFLVIDEAHLVGDDGSYLKFITELLALNPFLKVIGLSATGYRHGMGCLTNGKIFTDVVYDLCNIEGFARLIADGYIVPLYPPSTMPDGTALVQLDVSKVGISKGEFIQSELEAAAKAQNIQFRILQQFVELGANRASWLYFATGVNDANECAEILNSHFGIPTVVLHSKNSAIENDEALRAWLSGEARCAVNMGMLTTGVDHPALDYIGVGRATNSTALWIQILSRLTRPYDCFDPRVTPEIAAAFPYTKKFGLVADFAGNTNRNGTINAPKKPQMKGKGPGGDAPVRICKLIDGGCGAYNHSTAKNCIVCGMKFTFKEKLSEEPSTAELLTGEKPEQQYFNVDRVVYTRHVSKAVKVANPTTALYMLPATIKCCYYCNLTTFYAWVTVEGRGGQAGGRSWFRQVYDYDAGNPLPFIDDAGLPCDVPTTNGEVLKIVSKMRQPRKIRVWMNANPKPRVMAIEF